MFVGRMQNYTIFKSITPILEILGIPQPNIQKSSVPNKTQVVPTLEQKLGFSYLFNYACWKVGLEVGYQSQIYFDAVQSVDMTAPQVLPSSAPFSPHVAVDSIRQTLRLRLP